VTQTEEGSAVIILSNLPIDQTLHGRSILIETDLPEMSEVAVPVRVLGVQRDAVPALERERSDG
jgi:hypothetical protein